ncbi:hypothetical protein [Hydrococcus rivularis]|uniref:hypothetical protein n=1 Tax=Hydrococcus rivularis TaxID=1616834 RepID=UPI001114E944|nr:hypothetical protein [Hydrococcus rivularis]
MGQSPSRQRNRQDQTISSRGQLSRRGEDRQGASAMTAGAVRGDRRGSTTPSRRMARRTHLYTEGGLEMTETAKQVPYIPKS